MSNILEDDSITSSADMLSSSSTPFPPTSPQVAADPQQFINVDQLRSGMRSTLIPLVLWLLQDDISPSVVEAIMQIVAKIVKNDRHSTNLLCNSQLCTSDVISTGSHPVAASSLSAIDVLLTCGFAQEVTVNNYGILDIMAGCGLYPFVVGCLFSSSAETISEALTIIEFLSSNDEEFSIYVAEKSLLTVFSRMLMNDIDGDEINTPRVILTIFDGEIIAANKSSSEAEKQNLIRYPEDNYECVDLRSRSMAEQHNDCNQESDGEMENCSYSIEDKDFDRAIPSEEESELAEGCFIENRDIDYDCLPTVAPPSMQMEQEDKSQIECEAENFHCEGIKSSSKSILPCQIDISFQIPIFNWNERARIWSVMRTLMLNIFTHKNGFQSTEKYSKDSIEEKIVQPLNYSSTAPFDSQTIITVSSNSHSALSLNDFIQHRVIVALISTLEELASFQNKSDSSQLNFLPVNIFALQLLQTILILLRAGEEMLEKFNKMEEQKSMMQSSLDTNETTFINSFSSSSDESYDLFKNKPLCDLCLNYTNINTLNYFCRSKDKNLAEVANMICSRWIERVTTLVMCDSDSEWEDVIDSLITNG